MNPFIIGSDCSNEVYPVSLKMEMGMCEYVVNPDYAFAVQHNPQYYLFREDNYMKFISVFLYMHVFNE